MFNFKNQIKISINISINFFWIISCKKVDRINLKFVKMTLSNILTITVHLENYIDDNDCRIDDTFEVTNDFYTLEAEIEYNAAYAVTRRGDWETQEQGEWHRLSKNITVKLFDDDSNEIELTPEQQIEIIKTKINII